MTEHQMSRRSALKSGAIGAAGVGALSLAACGASGSGPGTNAAAIANGQAIANGNDGGGNPPAGAGPSVAGASGQALTSLHSIKVGEAVSAKLSDGSPVLVARPTNTTAACFSAICTHMGCTVKPAGRQLHCPCHGSVYDAVTGKVIHGPAPRALSPVAVQVVDGQVVTG